MVSTAALTSCSDDEVTPIPDETESTIENAYYITGIVSASGSALSGVTVTSGSATETTDVDGVYTLKMSNSATATVSFSKDGYIEINATAIFASGATVGDAVTLSQELTAKVEAQAVTAGEDATLTFDHKEESANIVVAIPATALTEDVEISATDYTPTATASTAETLAAVTETEGTATVVSTLSAVYLEPSGTTFETPVTISIPSIEVDGAYHAKLVDGEWVRQGDATYNTSAGAYDIEVDGFSQHSIAAESKVTVSSSSSSSSSTVSLAIEVIDNLGKADKVTQSVSYDQHAGWEFSGDSEISTYVAGLMGSSASEATISKSLDVTAAGDEKVTVAITQKIVVTTFTLGTYSATATSYGDVAVSIKTEQGDMRPDHN